MAGNMHIRKGVSKAGLLPNQADSKYLITSDRSTYLSPMETKGLREPWELRAFNKVDKIIKKLIPVFLILTVTYLTAHLAWLIFR